MGFQTGHRAALKMTKQELFELFQLVGLIMIYHQPDRHDDSDMALACLMEKFKEDPAFNNAYALARIPEEHKQSPGSTGRYCELALPR